MTNDERAEITAIVEAAWLADRCHQAEQAHRIALNVSRAGATITPRKG